MRSQTFLSLSAMSSLSTKPHSTAEGQGEPSCWPALVQGFHSLSYIEWGELDASRTVVCVHGFTRNSRDFDYLAERLSRKARMICVDLPGRGQSDWLSAPTEDKGYNYPQYMLDAAALIARLSVSEVDWIGTSLGAILGMLLAAQPKSPIRGLVMNDVGPFIPKSVVERLATYAGLDKDFDTSDDVEAYVRSIYAGFGNLTDAQWRHIAKYSERRKPNGKLGLAFDPGLAFSLKPPLQDIDLWRLWDAVHCPVLVLRGEQSEVLLPDVAEEMTRRGPRATVREFLGCGHAPALMSPEQIALVEGWLETGESGQGA
jgi:pimeloyl-ACP methyl ester carboxylesterase